MIDDLLVVRSFLLTDATLVALVGQRIYAARNEPIEGWVPSTGACLAFKRRGTGQDESGAMATSSLQFKCFGTGTSTNAQIISANAVYRALHDALNYRHSAAIMGAQLEANTGTFVDDATEWPFVLAFFRVQMRQSTIGA